MTPLARQTQLWQTLRRLIADYARRPQADKAAIVAKMRKAFAELMLISNLQGMAKSAGRLKVKGLLPEKAGGVESATYRILAQRVPGLKVWAQRLGPVVQRQAFWVTEQFGKIEREQVERLHALMMKRVGGSIGQRTLLDLARKTVPLAKFRLETIFRTNIDQAYHDGQWRQEHDPDVADAIVYREYQSARAKTSRPAHRAMHGFLAPGNDPIWNTIWPMNGFNCLCHSPRPIFMGEARRRRLVDAAGNPRGRVYASDTQRQLVESGRAVIEGQEQEFPDKGWGGNKGIELEVA